MLQCAVCRFHCRTNRWFSSKCPLLLQVLGLETEKSFARSLINLGAMVIFGIPLSSGSFGIERRTVANPHFVHIVESSFCAPSAARVA